MGESFHVAQAHGQQRLGSIHGLHQGFLVYPEYHRLLRRVQVLVTWTPISGPAVASEDKETRAPREKLRMLNSTYETGHRKGVLTSLGHREVIFS